MTRGPVEAQAPAAALRWQWSANAPFAPGAIWKLAPALTGPLLAWAAFYTVMARAVEQSRTIQ